MIRAISIVLIVAIVLQTVGCSTWQPLVRVNEVFEDDNQTPMREQAMAKLREGMRLRIVIRAGTQAPITGRVIECFVEEIGNMSLTVVPFTSIPRSNGQREFTLPYNDILSIEYRGVERKSLVFFGGVGIGTILGLLGMGFIFARSGD